MGSDLYQVSVLNHLELTKSEAIRRFLLRGHGYNYEPHRFFGLEDADEWVELSILVKAIHMDAGAGWGPTFVLRLLDEGVVDAEMWQGKPEEEQAFDYNSSPITLHYGGRDTFWGMGFGIDGSRPSIAWIDNIVYHPGEASGRRGSGAFDSCEYTVTIPKRFVPNLAGCSEWRSTAWHGTDEGMYDSHIETRRPRKVEVREILPKYIIEEGKVYSINDDKREMLEGLWPEKRCEQWSTDTSGNEYFISDGSVYRLLEEYQCEEVVFDGIKGPIRTFLFDDDGSVWLACKKELIHWQDGEILESYHRKNGFLSDKFFCLGKRSDGGLVACGNRGVSIQQLDGGWLEIPKKEILPREPAGLFIDAQDGIWTWGGDYLGYVSPDNEVTRYKKNRNFSGIAGIHQVSEQKFLVFARKLYIAAPGTNTLEEVKVFESYVEKSLKGLEVSHGRFWCSFEDGSLATLKVGEKMNLFIEPTAVIEKKEPKRYTVRLRLMSNGDLFCMYYNKIKIYRTSELEAMLSETPANKDVLDLSEVSSFEIPAYMSGR